MTDKEMVGVRLPADTLRRVEKYADDHDLSKSDALRRMIEKGVDLEEAGLTVAASQKTTDEEKEMVADGSGTIRGGLTTSFGMTLTVAVLSWVLSFTAVIPTTDALGMTFSAITVGIVLGVILYTSTPEKLDRIFYSGVDRVRQATSVVSKST